MKTTAFLSLLLVASSNAQDGHQDYEDRYNAITKCCEELCNDACDFLIEFPRIKNPSEAVGSVVAGRGNAVVPADRRRLQEDETVAANCCTSSGGGGGDPHIKVWQGDYFDFHGMCDLVLVDAPDFGEGLGLTIHIRTKIQHDYSFIESAALKIGDTDVLEVASWGEHFLNGVDSAVLFKKHLAAFPIDHQILNKKSHLITVDLGNNQKVIFKTFKDWVSVSLENASATDFKTSTGLMGHFFTGTKMARDGTTVMTDTNAFGQEWQVTAQEAGLFQVADRAPQFPHMCRMPDPAAFTESSTHRRLGEADVTEEAAKLACQHLDGEATREMCQYDVLAAGDLDMAQAGAF